MVTFPQKTYDYIVSKVACTPADILALVEKIDVVDFTAGQFIFSENDQLDYIYFIFDGYARQFSKGENAAEVTHLFIEPGAPTTDVPAFFYGQPAKTSLQAITTIKAARLSKKAADDLFDTYKIWERFGRLTALDYVYVLLERNQSLATLSARERFQEFFTAKPHIFNLAPLKHIASYLGITVETLSRLRSNSYES
jgi:CRP/FNR family transcriptional regulator, anaerobic regulatory protein